ncbi:hypothetical protein HYU16_05255 [Candidatus Woesearchaeota archaeon]|nr:hypothetical protein [Candidatus Woesearchaeota archaeon]
MPGAVKEGEVMGLFGFLKLGKKREDTISTLAAAAAQEEPEFLKKIDVAAAREIESEQAAGEGAEAALNAKEEVEPELALWLNNGATVKSLKELATALKKMKAADYKEHVNEERNDIAEWVKEIVNDDKLAGQLRSAKGRLQAARYVEKEILNLKTARRKAETAAMAAAKTMKATKPARKLVRARAAAEIKPAKDGIEMPKEAQETQIEKERLGDELELKLPEIPPITEKTEEAETTEAKRTAKPGRWFWPFKKKGPEEAVQAVPELPEFPKIPETPYKEGSIPELFAEEHPEAQAGMQGNREEEIVQKEGTVPELPSLEDLGELGEEFGMPETPRTGMGEFRPGKADRDQKSDAEAAELEPHYAQWAEGSGKGKEKETKEEAEEGMGEEMQELPASEEKVAGESARGIKKARERKTPEEAELDRKEEELDRHEKELSSEEAELNANKLDITRKRYELIKQKGEIERKKFGIFMRKHRLTVQRQETLLAEQPERLPDFAQELKGMPDLRLGGEYGKERLQALLEEAKQHIRQNNVDEAQKALEQAQSVFNTVYMTMNEKKEMEYEILEVEADLKLASLR